MVLVYYNKSKDADQTYVNRLTSALTSAGIKYEVIGELDLSKKINAECLFVLGGDGTILDLNTFANNNGIPILGINMGKLGFLSEFDKNDIEDAVTLFKNGELYKDYRMALCVEYNNKTFIALNDTFVQRVYDKRAGSLIADVNVNIDDFEVLKYNGDGVIISTPTGSTAYSLSAGGAILIPSIDAFIVTPIAAHTLYQRPVVCSADSKYEITVNNRASVELFADGCYIAKLNANDKFTVKKAEKKTIFLRKSSYNFFKHLNVKMKNTDGETL